MSYIFYRSDLYQAAIISALSIFLITSLTAVGAKDTKNDQINISKPIELSREIEEIDFAPYMTYVQKSVKSAWFPPKNSTGKNVTVIFKIQPNGQLTNLKLIQSSGIKNADKAALVAVKNTAPFKPLPKGSKPIEIKFQFDTNLSTELLNSQKPSLT